MPDVRSLFDKAYLYAYDLQGRDVTVKISKVTGGTLVGTGGKSNKKPILFFEGKEKGLAINITNARTIAGMYGGFNSEAWIGKWVTLYPTTTSFGSQTVECIRIRPEIPRQGGAMQGGGARSTGGATAPAAAASPPRDPGGDDDEEANRRAAEPTADEIARMNADATKGA